MAMFLEWSSTSIRDVALGESAARIVALIAVVWLVTFLVLQTRKVSQQVPKVSPTRQATNLQRPQQAFVTQKKKGQGHRPKKNKKVRGAVQTKLEHGAEVISDEEPELAQVQSSSIESSDLEASLVASPRTIAIEETSSARSLLDQALVSIQKPFVAIDVDAAWGESDAEDIEMCTQVALSISDPDSLEMGTTRGDSPEAPCVDEPVSLETCAASNVIDQPVEDICVCKMCKNPEMHSCPAHRTYTSSLLLKHRAIQLVVARGPPGLDPPTTGISKPDAQIQNICRLRVQ